MRTAHPHRRPALAAALLGLVVTTSAAPGRAQDVPVTFERLRGFRARGTPAMFNLVGMLEIGPPSAKNVLVLNPGTSASAAYFAPVAKTIVSRVDGWQVWAVERRENLLEDHSVLDAAKSGMATGPAVFDYYLGWLVDPSITTHFQLIPDADVGFAREWGMRVEIEDLRRVVLRARRRGGRVVLGGHSLGGSITTAYATWDFGGKPGAKGLAGLVYIDGGSNPTPITPDDARRSLAALQSGSPWLSFGGIPAPFAGIFNATGALGALIDPNSPSLGQSFPLLPADLKPPVPVTNLAQYGYALDTKTSPPALAAAQAHLGRIAETGTPPFGWDSTGAITPIERYATMFAGAGLKGLDGTAWYHPMRLTIDAGAVAAGNRNPAQKILRVRATHGHDLPHDLRICAFGAALGGQHVLDAATILASQSHIPATNLTLVNRADTYAHNDPSGAYPQNDFLDELVPFLTAIRPRR